MLSAITAEKVNRKAREFAEEMMRKLEEFNEECKAKMTEEEREAVEKYNKEHQRYTREHWILEFEACFVDYIFSHGIARFIK